MAPCLTHLCMFPHQLQGIARRGSVVKVPDFNASGCVVECRICNQEAAGSNLGRGYFSPRSTQPSIPPGSVMNTSCGWEGKGSYGSLRLRIERVGVQVKL